MPVKNSNVECNNHRPILLLSKIGKTIKQILHKRQCAFLEHNSCIYIFTIWF